MGRAENLDLVDRLYRSLQDRNEDEFAALYAKDATVRIAGVPQAMGGLLVGRDEIVENFRRRPVETVDVHLRFGDDEHVCVVRKRTSTLSATQTLKGNDAPWSAYECVVLRIADGEIKEHTTYTNWLDIYVQAGLIDLGSLIE